MSENGVLKPVKVQMGDAAKIADVEDAKAPYMNGGETVTFLFEEWGEVVKQKEDRRVKGKFYPAKEYICVAIVNGRRVRRTLHAPEFARLVRLFQEAAKANGGSFPKTVDMFKEFYRR